MTSANSAHPEDERTTRVWDPLVRIFHWSLVIAFALTFATGDDATWIHVKLGWFLAALVALEVSLVS